MDRGRLEGVGRLSRETNAIFRMLEVKGAARNSVSSPKRQNFLGEVWCLSSFN